MAEGMKDMDFEKMGFSKEEFGQANEMFAKMMGDFSQGAPGGDAPSEEEKASSAAPVASDTPSSSNQENQEN